MKASPQPAARRRYDAAFRAEALRLASESRGMQAARQLGINRKLLYKWQKAVPLTSGTRRCLPDEGVLTLGTYQVVPLSQNVN